MTPSYFFACIAVFVSAYTLNVIYVSVFYHRAFTHRAIQLHPWLEFFVIHTGSWVTGLDPKGWACMHRLHHQYSDTPMDPHSPTINGIWSVLPRQLYSYKKTLAALILKRKSYLSVVSDIDFPVNWLNKKHLWTIPYLLQAAIAITLGITFDAWLLAACYWIGMMSHPIQGWMVNALAHRYGYRNFNTPDNSKNNSAVAWLVFGEGYQNNHHHLPSSAKFSARPSEVDLGYLICRIFSIFGLLSFSHPVPTSDEWLPKSPQVLQ